LINLIYNLAHSEQIVQLNRFDGKAFSNSGVGVLLLCVALDSISTSGVTTPRRIRG
jgi:hypothetical protein